MAPEPKKSRQVVSDTVKRLLTDLVNEQLEQDDDLSVSIATAYSEKVAALAGYLSVTRQYLPVKMKRCHWDLDDLDRMANFFDLHPADFVYGYNHIIQKENKHG